MTSQSSNLDLIDGSRIAEIRRIKLRSKRSVSTDLLGQYRSSFRGSGLVFSDIREYQPGDDVKHIHWRATARTNTVYVKSYQEDRQLSVMLAIDTSASMGFGAPKTRYLKTLEFAALLVRLAEMGGDLIGLSLFSDDIQSFLPPKGSRSHRNAVFWGLSNSKSSGTKTNLARSLDSLRASLKRPSIVFVFSDFLCDPFTSELERLSAKHDVILVQTGSENESDIPNCGIVQFQDAETGQKFTIDTSDKATIKRILENAESRTKNLKESATQARVDLIELNQDPIQALIGLMRRRIKRFV